MSHSRRAFLKQVSTAAAVGLLAQVPGTHLWAMSASGLLPEPDEALLRDLALKAIDAARAAGATFADIRLSASRYVQVICTVSKSEPPRMRTPRLGFPSGYGIRAIVDGAWGFASSSELTADAVVATARMAVAVARGNKPRRPRTLELAPIDTVSHGTWATPIAQDPFAVPIGEQAELGLAAIEEAMKVKELTSAETNFHWRRPTTVFAATNGSLIVQRLALAMPYGVVGASVGPGNFDQANGGTVGLRSGGYGYEALEGRRIIPAMREAAERALALAHAARGAPSVEVGRYDIVFSPDAAREMVTTTLAWAVNAELALGYWANGAGSSFAAPPADILGKYQAAAPAITIRADRTRPDGAATVGWDEEGVRPDAYTIVKDGVIVDYHTNRETAPQLGDWYPRRGEPVRSHGCARGSGMDQPTVLLPNLTLEPGRHPTTLDDMIKDVKKGLYVEDGTGFPDQQMLNAQYYVGRTGVRYITNGKLGSYVRDVAFQFITRSFWKSIDALGGPGTVDTKATTTDSGAWDDKLQPFPMSTVAVVPFRARQVNVLNIGRTA